MFGFGHAEAMASVLATHLLRRLRHALDGTFAEMHILRIYSNRVY